MYLPVSRNIRVRGCRSVRRLFYTRGTLYRFADNLEIAELKRPTGGYFSAFDRIAKIRKCSSKPEDDSLSAPTGFEAIEEARGGIQLPREILVDVLKVDCTVAVM